MHLQCLGFDFYSKEKLLLLIRTSIRHIPVIVVVYESSFFPCNAPVTQFMQGAAFVVAGELYLGQ